MFIITENCKEKLFLHTKLRAHLHSMREDGNVKNNCIFTFYSFVTGFNIRLIFYEIFYFMLCAFNPSFVPLCFNDITIVFPV